METITCIFITIALLHKIVHSGVPISEPGTLNAENGGKIMKYNMIDTNPSCWERGICPMFPPGGRLSSFPNSEEKAQHLFHNLFRMHPNWTLELSYGKWRFGANKNGGLNYFCPTCKYCGDTSNLKAPLYWYSDANQAARFKQYDEKSCDQDWYDQDGNTAHHTCDWVLDEYGGGSHCDLFGSCTFGSRANSFCEEDRCWFETEGICGGNSCYFDPHCEPIFAAKYDYQGTGFVEGMNGAATVYSRFTSEIFYPLPSAAHFDERMKIVPEDYNEDGKYFTLMLEYYDHNKTQKPETCWSIYDSGVHEMDIVVSWNGDLINGFSQDSWSVMFKSNHEPPETCQPYAFICKTTLNNYFRLPEDNNYYFGTEWINWKWSNYSHFGKGYLCKENHYYYNQNEELWIVNGGPTLNRRDIWYYKDTNYGSCIGCNKIAKLQCYEKCILSDFNDCNGCDDIRGQIDPPLYDDDDDSNVGGIVAGVFIGLVCVIFIIAGIYYMKENRNELEFKCPKIGGINVNNVSKTKTSDDKNENVASKNNNKKVIKSTVSKKCKNKTVAKKSSNVSAIIASMNKNTNKGNEGIKTELKSICNECQQNKLANNGKVDKNDGHWYCSDCWKKFGE